MAEEIRHIQRLPDGLKPAQSLNNQRDKSKPSFSSVLDNLVKEVDDLHKTAEKTTDKMLTGELEDVHQVVVAMEEAQTSFKLLMEVRNKMVEAYREVMKMQV